MFCCTLELDQGRGNVSQWGKRLGERGCCKHKHFFGREGPLCDRGGFVFNNKISSSLSLGFFSVEGERGDCQQANSDRENLMRSAPFANLTRVSPMIQFEKPFSRQSLPRGSPVKSFANFFASILVFLPSPPSTQD